MDPETLRKYPKGTLFFPIDPEMADAAGLDDPNALVQVTVEDRKIIIECVDRTHAVHET